jgi:FHA domain
MSEAAFDVDQLQAAAMLTVPQVEVQIGNVFLVVRAQPPTDVASQLKTTVHTAAAYFRNHANAPPHNSPQGLPEGKIFCLARPGDNGARFFRLGRAPDCDLVIAESTVSRLHALILRDKDMLFRIKDLGSKAGTKVNDMALHERDSVPLPLGGHVDVGGLRIAVLNAAGLLKLIAAPVL